MNKSEKFINDIVSLFHNDYIDPPEFNKVIHKYKKKKKIYLHYGIYNMNIY